MERIEKTVFLSYRRTNIPWALAIFQNLTQHDKEMRPCSYVSKYDALEVATGDTVVIEEDIVGPPHPLRARALRGTCGLVAPRDRNGFS